MSDADEARLRRQVVDTALSMSRKGLSPQRSGNVSARHGDGFIVTPTGLPYEDCQAADMVFVGLDGVIRSGQKKPSSESPFHGAIYRAIPQAKAIVHCHSMAATALACARREIPAFHYMVAVAGSTRIPLAAYATFGTDALADSILEALEGGYRACLLANHGQIAWGPSLDRALELAAEVETLARQYIDVLALGQPHILDDGEMQRVLARFAGYGQQG